MKLSIIIPVFKVEKYLRKCLDSCLNQDISADMYEIIAVNDGSPDKCEIILNEYSKKYPQLSVINQSNQGLSIARNKGLENARGDYVWFIDSDDWIEPQSLSLIIKSLDSISKDGKTIDIIQIGYRNVFEGDEKITIPKLPQWHGIITGADYMTLPHLPTPVQFNIYRRSLLLKENLFFYPEIYHEDIEFKPRVLHFCKSCICIEKKIYNYLKRNTGNITASFKLKNGLDLNTTNESLSEFISTHSLSQTEKQYFTNRICITCNLIINGFRFLNPYDRKILASRFLKNKNVFKIMRNSSCVKYKLEGYLLSLFPKITLRLLNKLSSHKN